MPSLIDKLPIKLWDDEQVKKAINYVLLPKSSELLQEDSKHGFPTLLRVISYIKDLKKTRTLQMDHEEYSEIIPPRKKGKRPMVHGSIVNIKVLPFFCCRFEHPSGETKDINVDEVLMLKAMQKSQNYGDTVRAYTNSEQFKMEVKRT